MLDLLEKGNYNPNLFWINKIPKRFLCVYQVSVFRAMLFQFCFSLHSWCNFKLEILSPSAVRGNEISSPGFHPTKISPGHISKDSKQKTNYRTKNSKAISNYLKKNSYVSEYSKKNLQIYLRQRICLCLCNNSLSWGICTGVESPQRGLRRGDYFKSLEDTLLL